MKFSAGKSVAIALVSGALALSLAGCASSTSQSSSAGDAANISSSQAQASPDTIQPGDVDEVQFDEADIQGSMANAEAFVDQYVDYVKDYRLQNEPDSMKDEYNKLTNQYNELKAKLDSLNESDFSSNVDRETYTEAMARISDKLEELNQ